MSGTRPGSAGVSPAVPGIGGLRAGPRGFTLVEVLITSALLVIALFLLFIPITNSLGYFRSGTARVDAQSVARIALDNMARELQEAMCVQLDMYDNSLLAFIPPLRVNPYDPTSEIVTPPRPDWEHGIRYWRALYDPTIDYNPGTHITLPGNTYYLARTVVEQPYYTGDAWNRWNQAWATAASTATPPLEGVTNWAPIPRIVNTDVDIYGARTDLQPGFPYLAAQWLVRTGQVNQTQAARDYRDLVVGLTPNSPDYDVMDLSAQPLVVSGEWLSPIASAQGPDYSLYRTRYPLLRMGVPYFGWAALGHDRLLFPAGAQTWARDPFLLIYHWTGAAYELWDWGCFDPRSRTMRAIHADAISGLPVTDYDTGLYPYRQYNDQDAAPRPAFGVDWVQGAFRFDFPPPGTPEAMAASAPMSLDGSLLTSRPLAGPPAATVYDRALLEPWAARGEHVQTSYFLVPSTVTIRTNTNSGEFPDRVLTRVYSTPRDGTDTFQVNDYDFAEVGGDVSSKPKYGYIRLPENLADGKKANTHYFWVSFRWHTNGVWQWDETAGAGVYRPDLVCAYYRSAAVLDLSLTVTRADPSAKAGQRIAQSALLTRRVKLHNALREIRYER
jgi:prepilin-type N-terminal cleavage/methylation domain-containing protein